jgi:hypothetical protein
MLRRTGNNKSADFMMQIVSRYIETSMRVVFLLAAVVPALAQLPTCSVPTWSPCDLTFDLQPGEDASRAELRAEFRSPHKDTRAIRGFIDGNRFVIRFTPDEVGEWDYRVTSTIRRFDGQLGKAIGTASDAPGFVRPANTHHFQTANLQPHLWMASAIDNFITMPRADFEAAVAARASEKFTHLRVTLEPKSDLKEAADRILVIHNRGLVTDLVMAPVPDDRRAREGYVTDIVARFAAFNLTWAGVPAFEEVKNAKATLRDVGTLISQLDPYKHPRTSMAELSSIPLSGDNWMNILSYGTPDANLGAVDHQSATMPSVNTGIRTRADLWNATMNGQYPASGSGREFSVWFDFMSKTRYWELEPYFDVSGGRAIAVRDVELRNDVIDAVEYIVYVEKPKLIELNVQKQTYDAEWINPATGERVPMKDLKGTATFAGEPPDATHDWVLHLSREGHKESLLKKYKFESRPLTVQKPETDAKNVPFEIEMPTGEISARAPGQYLLKIARATRATRELLVSWTAELTTGNEGARIVGTGREGTLKIPAMFAEHAPSLVTIRASVLNANGKLYFVDRVFKLVP